MRAQVRSIGIVMRRLLKSPDPTGNIGSTVESLHRYETAWNFQEFQKHNFLDLISCYELEFCSKTLFLEFTSHFIATAAFIVGHVLCWAG